LFAVDPHNANRACLRQRFGGLRCAERFAVWRSGFSFEGVNFSVSLRRIHRRDVLDRAFELIFSAGSN